MDKVPSQLTLGLSLKDETTFENFYAGENIEMIAALKAAVCAQGEKIIFLHGNKGEGCTHLLHACCHYAHQQRLSAVYLPLAALLQGDDSLYERMKHSQVMDEKNVTPELLNGLESLSVVCFDDLHAIKGQIEWEEAVFHLYNRLYDNGGSIIMAAHEAPKALSLRLPDLASRLSWGIVYKLHSLADDEKLAALMMRAHSRGIGLSEEVGRYLLTHCPRQMDTLFAALNTLDIASLTAQRRLTIPFVKEVLAI